MIEFRWLKGDAAQAIDPDHIRWPADTNVLYVIEDGEIIGRSSILMVPMIEGTFLRIDKRSGTLAARIIREVEKRYLEEGQPAAMAFAPESQPEIAEYLERFGFEEQPLTMYKKNLIAEREAA